MKKLFLYTQIFSFLLSATLLSSCQNKEQTDSKTPEEKTKVSNALDGWDYNIAPDSLTSMCENVIEESREILTRLENSNDEPTLQSVFQPYDEMGKSLQRIQHVWYMKSVHPDPEIRNAATICVQNYSSFATEISLSRKFFDRVALIETKSLNDPEKLMVKRKLRDFRKSGVDKSEEIRAKIKNLNERITELGSNFDQTIREDTRYIETTLEALDGLPTDFIASREADENGKIKISTDYPDYFPIMQYAHNDELRRRLYVASKSIGSPSNSDNLMKLITKRHELASVLGYENYAALAMDGLMMQSPSRAAKFLNELGVAVKNASKNDLAVLLERQKKINPEATEIQAWQSSYLSNLVRQESYALDAKEVRRYFHFDKVQSGIFDLTESLFGVSIVSWKTDTWHEDVSAWEIQENGSPIGRFYLDMHPREDKYKHAAHWTLRSGLKNSDQLPLSGLATNFPKDYMEHNQVETYLHEFGHLLHNMFSGTQDWLDLTGMSMERDFVEAPSQMLEEWIWDKSTLQKFATNDAGEPIPDRLINKMNAARNFTKAMGTAQQLFYSNVSLSFYSKSPEEINLIEMLKDLQKEYSPYPYVDGTYFYNNFGHLNGYSSNYYIYQWSLAIATDLFERFKDEGLNNVAVASDYRRKILEVAGSKPADEFIEEFLGRPFSIEAYIDLLSNL